jgi:hypothetical protein
MKTKHWMETVCSAGMSGIRNTERAVERMRARHGQRRRLQLSAVLEVGSTMAKYLAMVGMVHGHVFFVNKLFFNLPINF